MTFSGRKISEMDGITRSFLISIALDVHNWNAVSELGIMGLAREGLSRVRDEVCN